LLDELDTKLFWTDPAVWPIADAQLMTPFGVRSYNEDTTFSSRHTGIDLSTTLNAPVMTINNGTVIYSDELTETGHTIIIDHGLGLKSWYYHLSERLVEVGDIVAKGETIAKAGMTGNSTTAHLHLNLSVNSTYINPEVALNSPLFH
jgi:murein DD-endopeptidase MepM/ murein hydrolase activator NlpD